MFFDLFDHDINHQFYRYLQAFLSKKEIDFTQKDNNAHVSSTESLIEQERMLFDSNMSNAQKNKLPENLEENKIKQQDDDMQRLIELQYGSTEERKKNRKEQEKNNQNNNKNNKISQPRGRIDMLLFTIPPALICTIIYFIGKKINLW